VPSDALEGVALVTGGGRGIGARVARELAEAGMQVAVTGRTRETIEQDLGPIELLVCNAGVAGSGKPFLEESPDEWWRVFEVNVLGAYICCRTVAARMARRGRGRIVNMGSGASYLPVRNPSIPLGTSYGASKAALGRFSETLATVLGPLGIRVFLISPGRVRTDMTERLGSEGWTPPELAPRLVRVLASGRADALAGRYVHAEHDDIEDLIRRADEVVANDLNAIRLLRRRRNAD